MQLSNPGSPALLHQQRRPLNRMRNPGFLVQSASLADQTVELLAISPHQRILEIGYGEGRTLQRVAQALKKGFLAGTDESFAMYQKSSARNRRYIGTQLMQLHLGGIGDLAYPHHYFDSIYVIGNLFSGWKDPSLAYYQLIPLLRCGGKLLLIDPATKSSPTISLQLRAAQIRLDLLKAGFLEVITCVQAGQPDRPLASLAHKY